MCLGRSSNGPGFEMGSHAPSNLAPSDWELLDLGPGSETAGEGAAGLGVWHVRALTRTLVNLGSIKILELGRLLCKVLYLLKSQDDAGRCREPKDDSSQEVCNKYEIAHSGIALCVGSVDHSGVLGG